MKAIDYTKKKKQFAKLWSENLLNQKEIASELNLSEQTVSRWTKAIKKNLYTLLKIKTKLIQKISLALDDKETNSTDIHNFTTSLVVIQKQIDRITVE